MERRGGVRGERNGCGKDSLLTEYSTLTEPGAKRRVSVRGLHGGDNLSLRLPKRFLVVRRNSLRPKMLGLGKERMRGRFGGRLSGATACGVSGWGEQFDNSRLCATATTEKSKASYPHGRLAMGRMKKTNTLGGVIFFAEKDRRGHRR